MKRAREEKERVRRMTERGIPLGAAKKVQTPTHAS